MIHSIHWSEVRSTWYSLLWCTNSCFPRSQTKHRYWIARSSSIWNDCCKHNSGSERSADVDRGNETYAGVAIKTGGHNIRNPSNIPHDCQILLVTSVNRGFDRDSCNDNPWQKLLLCLRYQNIVFIVNRMQVWRNSMQTEDNLWCTIRTLVLCGQVKEMCFVCYCLVDYLPKYKLNQWYDSTMSTRSW